MNLCGRIWSNETTHNERNKNLKRKKNTTWKIEWVFFAVERLDSMRCNAFYTDSHTNTQTHSVDRLNWNECSSTHHMKSIYSFYLFKNCVWKMFGISLVRAMPLIQRTQLCSSAYSFPFLMRNIFLCLYRKRLLLLLSLLFSVHIYL